MTDKFDVNSWLKTYRDAFAPVQRAQAEGFKAFERFARHQYAVAGDVLEFSLHATKVALAVKSGEEFTAAQRELGADVADVVRAARHGRRGRAEVEPRPDPQPDARRAAQHPQAPDQGQRPERAPVVGKTRHEVDDLDLALLAFQHRAQDGGVRHVALVR